MRTYTPHEHDRAAARDTIAAIYERRISASVDELAALHAVANTYPDDTVTQHCICRAHDAIDRMRSKV